METFTAELTVILLMLVFNAGFAAFEMALASVSKARVRHLREKGYAGAESAAFLKERVEASLSLIQLGITLAGAAAAATGGAGVNEMFAPRIGAYLAVSEGTAEAIGLILFVLPLSFVTIVFGELVPKVFAIENKEFILLKFSPLFRWLYFVCSPALYVFELIVKSLIRLANSLLPGKKVFHENATLSELRMAAAQARDESVIGRMEEKIVNAAAALSLRKAGEFAIPLRAVSSIPASLNLQEALLRAHMDLHTRFPVTKGAGQDGEIIGYVNFKDIVTALKMHAPSADVAGITRPIEKIRADISAPKALEGLIARNAHIAVAIDSDGRQAGLITLEDIIGNLVGGPIKDEYDRLPNYLYAAGGGLIAGGSADMAEVMRRLELKPEAGNITLAAWLEKELGRQPAGSEVVKSGGLTVLVRKTRRGRVSEALITRAQAPI